MPAMSGSLRRTPAVKRVVKISALVLLAFVLSIPVLVHGIYFFFGRDYQIHLPHGYRLTRIWGSTVMMTGYGCNIEPNVTGYRVCGGTIVGRVSAVGLPPEYSEVSQPGYFLVDTRTHKVLQGLDERHWTRLLAERGVTRTPRLFRPSRWDALLGRNRSAD